MKQHRLRSRLASAFVLAVTLAVATACSSLSSGQNPNYAGDQNSSTFQAIAGGY